MCFPPSLVAIGRIVRRVTGPVLPVGWWLTALLLWGPGTSLAEHLADVEPDRLLVMGTADAPPYMIRATHSGLDVDIIRAALARLGYRLEVRYMPLARAEQELKRGRIDLMTPLPAGEKAGTFSSAPHTIYRPTVFSLKERDIQLQTLADLGEYRLMTFQGATDYLGPEFAEASQRSPGYLEIHNMKKLAQLLFAGHTDLVMVDYNIFYHQMRRIGADQAERLRVHNILPRVPAVVGFHRAELRDAFNGVLQSMRDDGSHTAIRERYAPL